MKTDKYQDKYDEIFQNLKDEKMDWDFDDFLKRTENQEEAKIVPIKKSNVSYAKILWIAASVLLIFGLVFMFKNFNGNKIQQKDEFVKNEIERQKKSGELVDTLSVNRKTFAINDSLKAKQQEDSLETDSATVENTITIDQILSKRGRIRRTSRPVLADNAKPDQKTPAISLNDTIQNYKSNYVFVNGKAVENQDEAIDATKKAFKILASNISQTINETKVIDELNVNF